MRNRRETVVKTARTNGLRVLPMRIPLFLRVFANYVAFPTEKLLSAGNIVFFSVCLCCGALFGSGVSVYVIVGIVFGTGHIVLRNIPLPMSRPIVATALAFASFAAAETLSSFLNSGFGHLTEQIENLPFLGLLPLFALIFADRGQLLAAVEKSAAAAAISAYGLALFVLPGEGGRTELLSGNASVLALLASVLLVINCAAARRRFGRRPWTSLAGAAASVGLVLATGTRGMLPVIILAPVAVLAAFGGFSWQRLSARAAAAGFIAFIAVGGLAYQALMQRAAATRSEITAIRADRYDTPIGLRLTLWRAGLSIAAENPVFGAGPGNARHLMAERTRALSGAALSSSHFHNAAINELARAGIVGLAALLSMFAVPFALCRRAEKDDIAKSGFAVLCGVQCAYLLSGLTGVMLGHDILDAVYLCAVVFSLYLVFPDPGRAGKIVWT